MQQNAGELTSWADVVRRGHQAQPADEVQRELPLVPSSRGSRQALCSGEFLVMLGHYGWIMSMQAIDHPDTDRHGGRIYVNGGDVRDGAVLTPGCRVLFYLYADENGLGAEDCHLAFDQLPESVPSPPKAHQAHSMTSGLRTPLRTDARSWQHNDYASMMTFRQMHNEHALVTLVPIDTVSQWLDATQSNFSAPCSASAARTRCMEAVQADADLSATTPALRTQCALDSDEEESVPLGMWSSLAARCSKAIGDAAWADTPCAGNIGKPRVGSRGSDVSTAADESSDSDSGLASTPPVVPLRPPPGLEALAELMPSGTQRVNPPPGLEFRLPPGIA